MFFLVEAEVLVMLGCLVAHRPLEGQLRGICGSCWNTGHTTLLERYTLDDLHGETQLSKCWQ